MLRFLLTPRWLGFGAFVIALAVTCVFLGMWQHDRHEQRQQHNAQVESHAESAPIPIQQAAPLGTEWPSEDEWTQVTATGQYDPQHEVLVKFQQRGSQPGVDVVTPLVLDDGSAVLVDRGWVQTQNTASRPGNIPPPPSGQVTVTGWLRADSTNDGQAVRPEDGQVRLISSEALSELVPHELATGYIALREQDPPLDGLEPAEPPELGMGVNLFYSWQWYFFAGLAGFGFFWFARAEVKERRRTPEPDQADQLTPS